MKSGLVALLLLTSAATAWAHPGWGIVQDSRGNVYFTDTRQVWRVSPDGKVAVAVPNVHTHELWIDADDNLYGEHLSYNASAPQPWKHRVWRRRPNGSVTDVIRTRDGFLSNYSFVRDRAGNMYWAERGGVTVIKRRSVNGSISTHAAADFQSVERMTATEDGTLLLMDAGNLRRVSPTGVVTTIVTALSGLGRPAAEVGRPNYHMGLWTDREGRVYVAAAAEGLVLTVERGRQVRVAARSTAPWAPSGGLIARDKALWILEYDTANAVRARRIDRAGMEQTFLPGRSH